jgi:hypothetical protein
MPLFKKLTGSFYRKENRILKKYIPGNIIDATQEELEKGDPGLKTWEKVGESPIAVTKDAFHTVKIEQNDASKLIEEKKAVGVLKRGKNVLKVVPVENSDDLFNVVNEKTGENLNDVPLNEEDANKLVEDFKVIKAK